MPNQPKTTGRHVRVEDARWAAAEVNTEAIGTNRAAWINAALAWLNGEPGAKRPVRPAQPQPPQS
ncbi:hypothetical protein [Saccharothrix deserti]|uniref:hypothetical protein n=1 Tax=Saccharothrix deserti TaxID=2593674 RepID=UPI00131B0EB8|nr:hypothetical protein [Saccharothrix deserti]